MADAEVPLGGEEGKEKQTDEVPVPDVEEGIGIDKQGHVSDKDEVDVPMEAEDEDVGPRLRSGARYGLRRLTKSVNSHRNRFEHKFSGANVGIKG